MASPPKEHFCALLSGRFTGNLQGWLGAQRFPEPWGPTGSSHPRARRPWPRPRIRCAFGQEHCTQTSLSWCGRMAFGTFWKENEGSQDLTVPGRHCPRFAYQALSRLLVAPMGLGGKRCWPGPCLAQPWARRVCVLNQATASCVLVLTPHLPVGRSLPRLLGGAGSSQGKVAEQVQGPSGQAMYHTLSASRCPPTAIRSQGHVVC